MAVPGMTLNSLAFPSSIRSHFPALRREPRISCTLGKIPRGHMNVLLAEANVAYDHLYDIEAINDEFAGTDVALVVGANDAVNPAAKTDPRSPIYGMPVLNAEQAHSVIVLKRSMNPGFAKIENELFVRPNTMMLFGDAKETLTQLVGGLKDEG
jgi:NAD(P) transhydrogenase subunit beta